MPNPLVAQQTQGLNILPERALHAHGFFAANIDPRYGVVPPTSDDPFAAEKLRSCLQNYSPESCLQYALSVLDDVPLTPSKLPNLIVAVKKFVEMPSIIETARDQARIGLAALYIENNQFDEVGSLLRTGTMNAKLITKIYSGKIKITTHIAEAARLHNLKNTLNSEKVVKQASHDANSAEGKLLEAAKLWKQGKIGTAEKYFKRAIALNPDFEQFGTDMRNSSLSYQEFKKKFYDTLYPVQQQFQPRRFDR